MDGSDNQPKSSTIPLWQHDSQEKPKTKQDASDIVDVARRWLVDDSVRTSTREEKIAFLESKGLASDQIQELLGIATQKSTEASVSPFIPWPNSLYLLSSLSRPKSKEIKPQLWKPTFDQLRQNTQIIPDLQSSHIQSFSPSLNVSHLWSPPPASSQHSTPLLAYLLLSTELATSL